MHPGTGSLQNGLIDLHCHILPGLDDGPRTMEESIEMCRIAHGDGIRVIVAMPHTLNGLYYNDAAGIRRSMELLEGQLKRTGPSVKILAGSEVHANPEIPQMIRDGRIETINRSGNSVMLELPEYFLPEVILSLVGSLIGAGVVPVISHPERLPQFQDVDLLRKLVEMGALAQITAMSLTGGFGGETKDLALSFLSEGLVYVIASDGHSPRERPPTLSKAVEEAGKVIGTGAARLLVADNPLRILEGRLPERGGQKGPDKAKPAARPASASLAVDNAPSEWDQVPEDPGRAGGLDDRGPKKRPAHALERRASMRHSARFSILFGDLYSGSRMEGEVADFSERGLKLKAAKPLPAGSTIALSVGNGASQRYASGVIKWSKTDPSAGAEGREQCLMGVSLELVSEGFADALAQQKNRAPQEAEVTASGDLSPAHGAASPPRPAAVSRDPYEPFFGFRENPFRITPDPRFLYFTRNHREALASLTHGVTSRKGFVVLTGEVGTGKTTLVRALLERLGDDFNVSYIFHTKLTEAAFIKQVCTDFGLDVKKDSKGGCLMKLNRFLLSAYQQGKTSVLIVDEAQNLTPSLFEEIRLLTNLETSTDKLLQIVLVGQPELNQHLQLVELRQLRQRISHRYHLEALDGLETSEYIHARMRIAGCVDPDCFSEESIEMIHQFSKGIPRLINIICDNALLTAYATNNRDVDEMIIREVVDDLGLDDASEEEPEGGPEEPSHKRGRSLLFYMFLSFLAGAAIAAVLLLLMI